MGKQRNIDIPIWLPIILLCSWSIKFLDWTINIRSRILPFPFRFPTDSLSRVIICILASSASLPSDSLLLSVLSLVLLVTVSWFVIVVIFAVPSSDKSKVISSSNSSPTYSSHCMWYVIESNHSSAKRFSCAWGLCQS